VKVEAFPSPAFVVQDQIQKRQDSFVYLLPAGYIHLTGLTECRERRFTAQQ
jgi:hypothetical protein